MTEHRERLKRALRGCAEAGVPEPVDLWPAVRERASTGRTGDESATRGEEVRTWPRSVSNAPLALALTIFSVVILSAVVYVAARPLQAPSQHGPSNGEKLGAEKDVNQGRGKQSDDAPSGLSTEIGHTLTMDGASVTLEWAYADEKFVAVGLDTRYLEGHPASQQRDTVVFEPSLWDDTVGNEAKLPPYVKVTDASGQDFDTVGGGTLLGPRRTEARAVFDAPEGLDAGREHIFHLEVPLYQSGRSGVPGEKPDAGPFDFRFGVPVRPAPTIEIDQEVEAKGITLTLARVVDSPLLPQAIVCFEPPDDKHDWTPFLAYDDSYDKEIGSVPQKLGNGCWSLQMVASESLSPVTVTNLEGFPKGSSLDPNKDGSVNPKTIHGPWRFDFEVPETPGS